MNKAVPSGGAWRFVAERRQGGCGEGFPSLARRVGVGLRAGIPLRWML